MASLHSSLLLPSNLLSLATPSSSSTRILLNPTPSLRPLLTTRRRFGRPFAVAEQATVSDAARRLYIGNIPRTVTNDELSNIVQEHGAVEKAEVMYDKYSGRSRRFAFVTMKTVEDANAVIEKLNGTEIGGRGIKVNVTEKPLSTLDSPLLQAEESEFVDSPHKVYVGNLAKTVTTDTLKKFFSEKGKVLSAKVSRVPGTSKSSGYGFVTFSSEEDVEAAISSFNNSKVMFGNGVLERKGREEFELPSVAFDASTLTSMRFQATNRGCQVFEVHIALMGSTWGIGISTPDVTPPRSAPKKAWRKRHDEIPLQEWERI
ncbi:30S ribosomal protein 2, chloroplastic [Mucuna pruriens]|uniref:Small ribosomal subunit protein cS22 n=1 Tax=Mucuna pruriens TaxID=157652 RepID=A0A371DZ06_MUCPR|nr:30S ribosomal protein 2, chloroplastic [Mucuna pruriens]